MNGRISTLSETLDYVSNNITNVDSKMEDNYHNISDVEVKVVKLKEEIGRCIPGFHVSKGSGIGKEQYLESVHGPTTKWRR